MTNNLEHPSPEINSTENNELEDHKAQNESPVNAKSAKADLSESTENLTMATCEELLSDAALAQLEADTSKCTGIFIVQRIVPNRTHKCVRIVRARVYIEAY